MSAASTTNDGSSNHARHHHPNAVARWGSGNGAPTRGYSTKAWTPSAASYAKKYPSTSRKKIERERTAAAAAVAADSDGGAGANAGDGGDADTAAANVPDVKTILAGLPSICPGCGVGLQCEAGPRCTLPPPKPIAPIAARRLQVGFISIKPCTCQVKTRVQNVPFNKQRAPLYSEDRNKPGFFIVPERLLNPKAGDVVTVAGLALFISGWHFHFTFILQSATAP
jgi:hypothetical protein